MSARSGGMRAALATFELAAVFALAPLVVGSVVPLLALDVAHAQPAPTRSRAERGRLHFESGQAYFEDGDYARALAEYQSAFDLTARPNILVNIALSLEGLDRLAEALDHFERFLASGVESPLRAGAETKVPELRARIAAGEGVEGAEGAEGTPGEGIEGTDGGEGPPSDTRRRHRRRQTPSIDLAAPPPDGAEEPVEPEKDTLRIAAHATLFSLAGVGLITGAVLGFLTLAEDASLTDGCGARGGCTSSELSNIRTFRLGADLAFFGSFVSALAGTFMILLDSPDSDEDAHDDAADTQHAASTFSVRVAPFVNETSAGLVAAGRL